MKAFRYALEGVLHLRRRQQDHRAGELVAARAELREAEVAREREQACLDHLLASETAKPQPGDANALQHRSACTSRLQRRQRICQGQVATCEDEVDARLSKLVASRKEVRKLEIHRKRKQEGWAVEARREADKQLDDTAARKHHRDRVKRREKGKVS